MWCVPTITICRTKAACSVHPTKTAEASTRSTMRPPSKAADAPLEATEHTDRAVCDALPWKGLTAAFRIKQYPSFGRGIMEITRYCQVADGNLRPVQLCRHALLEPGPVLEEAIKCAQVLKMNATRDALARNAAPCSTWKTAFATSAPMRLPPTPFLRLWPLSLVGWRLCLPCLHLRLSHSL